MAAAWYCTREDVVSSLAHGDVLTDNAQIDRCVAAASRSVEGLLHRVFYPRVASYSFDWPDAPDTSRSWRKWLPSDRELISVTTVVSGGTTITTGVNLEPQEWGPPYDRIEIDLSDTASFSSGSTHQNSLVVTGLWGYTDDQGAAGTSINAINDTAQVFLVGSAATGVRVGVGSVVKLDSERMLVTEIQAVDTGQDTTSTMAADDSDTALDVGDGTAFMTGEKVIVDSEVMLVVGINGNTLVVKRAWGGTVLATHASGATVSAYRQLIIERGAFGTTAATHSSGALTVWQPPSLLRSLTVAEAMVMFEQENSAYARVIGTGENVQEARGAGLDKLRAQAKVELGTGPQTAAV